ncbi:MAG: hypothetical protein HZA54_15300, partial [Planctomycetes bacterium]|nr:hypothetical protein [Planctomycetota bacterium]
MRMAAAGLCHDLGKWLQRAALPAPPERDRLEALLCPPRPDGRYSHQHALWTYVAIAGHLRDALSRIVPPDRLEAFACLAARHHAPAHHPAATALDCPAEEFILRQADWCSAGVDRMPDDEGLSGRFDATLLRPVFLDIDLGARRPPEDLRYALAALEDGPGCEPHPALPLGHGRSLAPEYRALWEAFLRDLPALPAAATPAQALDLLDGLLARYTWSIPSATNSAPDIPLLDHSRTVGALAETLARYYRATGRAEDERAVMRDPEAPRLLLVGGDLSGIQAWLVRSRTARGQARRLRARSFLLAALTRAVATHLLRALDLPHLCIVAEAGGRFQLLAPATDPARAALERARQEVRGSLLADFVGEVAVHVAWVPLSITDFSPARYRARVAALAVALEGEKTRPLGERGGGWRLETFVRAPRGGSGGGSGAPANDQDDRAPRVEESGTGPGEAALAEFGRRLVRAAHVVLAAGAASPPGALPLLGGRYHLQLLETPPRRLPEDWVRVESYAGREVGLPGRPSA